MQADVLAGVRQTLLQAQQSRVHKMEQSSEGLPPVIAVPSGSIPAVRYSSSAESGSASGVGQRGGSSSGQPWQQGRAGAGPVLYGVSGQNIGMKGGGPL